MSRDFPNISFIPNQSDPSRQWAMTRATPIAQLLIAGRIACFTRAVPPPKRLIGQRLKIHAGAGLVKIRPLELQKEAQRLIGLEANCEPDNWRKGLDILKAKRAGHVLGDAQLVGAFVVGQLIGGEGDAQMIASYRPDSHGKFYLGDWTAFDGHRQVTIGNWNAPNFQDKASRWVWCFRDAVRCSPIRVGDGFGGLWDYEAGRDLRAQQARDAVKAKAGKS